MKTFVKNISIFLSLLILANCGIVNSFYTIGYSFKTELTPHSYKVKRTGENSFPENGKSVVSLSFMVGDGHKKSGVDTLWRKINDDGSFSKRIHLTYWDPFKRGRIESMIEPGKYFLDGFRYNNGKFYMEAGSFSALITHKQGGWDKVKKEAMWFSFEVKKGKEIFIPDVEVLGTCVNNSTRCEQDKILISIKVNDENDKTPKPYKIGYKIQN